MNIYTQLAEALLLQKDYTFLDSPLSGKFGFKYMKDYSGLMAQPPKTGASKGIVKRPKQGLFDIVITTGERFAKVTHREIFNDLLVNTDVDSCLRIWKGEDTREVGETQDEVESLTTIALLMFEQEVNWGKESWQRGSNFSPLTTQPTKRRPRDMIMGYARQAFHFGIDRLDEMKYWMTSRPGTIWFTDRDESPWGYSSYPDKLKRFFIELEGMDGTQAVMVGDVRDRFKRLADSLPDNLFYKG